MKKISVLLVVTATLFMMSSCSNKNGNEPETTTQNTETSAEQTEASTETTETNETNETNETIEANDREILSAFEALGGSNKVDLVKMSVYLKENIEKVSAETSDLMVRLYESVQMQLLPTYQDAFFVPSIQSTLLSYSIEDLRQNKVKEEAIKALLTEATSVGYKIEAIEGTVAPYVDYGYFAQFAEYTTEPTSAFFELMKIEADAPTKKDAALIIPWADVLKRGNNFETYLASYPESYYSDRVRMHLEGYTNLAINGSANVPIFEFDTNGMNTEAKAAYSAFVDQGLQTEFATRIKNYMTLLKTHDFVKTAEVEAFISEYN